MLSKEDNEKLTQVGPGTPMGNLLRRYWQPIAGSAELLDKPTKAIRILGEDLVLYKDKGGTLGLVEERCAHRRVNLVWGIPETNYHGWLYDETGQCIQQPGEPTGSTFKDRIQLTSYPVQELGGLIFAYLGPAPVPLLPRYDVFVQDNAIRDIGGTVLACNWLQCMENSLDPVHTEWLHGYLTDYWLDSRYGIPAIDRPKHAKIGFDRFEHGIYKRRVYEGRTEADDTWQLGHPIVFPEMLRISSSFQIRVPMDDTHTYHIIYHSVRPGIPVEPQDPVPYYEITQFDEDGVPSLETNAGLGQDFWAWYSQGDIARRDLEKLGVSDIGIILYREMLLEQMEVVARGADPIEVYRDPAKNQFIGFALEHGEDAPVGQRAAPAAEVEQRQSARDLSKVRSASRNPPLDPVRRAARRQAAELAAAGQPLLPPNPHPEPQLARPHHREGLIRPETLRTGS